MTEYQNPELKRAAEKLLSEFEELKDKRAILRSPALSALYDRIRTLPTKERAAYGRELNLLKSQLETKVKQAQAPIKKLSPIDVTAPFDVNTPADKRPGLLTADQGSQHPVTSEIEKIVDIFGRMGFEAVESRELDDDYHMFTSLNFPAGHPARDEYDTFVTDEGLVAPAHTSTMQNRIMRERKPPIRAIVPGRVFRNEDLDARHEHTFYQLEGIYIDEGINAGHLIATLKAFLSSYFEKDVEVKTQPFYFPFTEPSFEFAASCPFCDKQGCNICSYTGWIELLGCGMIHPNVLREGKVDPAKYTGFAWGGGIERLVMIKYGIEDIRLFHSANLKFLRQF